MFKPVILLILLSFFTQALDAQLDAAQLSQRIEEERRAWDVPGMAVAVVKDGKVLLASGYGHLQDNLTEEVNEHTLFAIASNTKAFVSAAIAMLVEEGAIRWDDPVRRYLPDFEMGDPCVSSLMTIKDLLCHRSGLGTFSGDVIWYKSTFTAAEAVKRISAVPPAFQFRNGYGYSNLMFITAGEVIRAVTGLSWAEFVESRIFNPLDMTRTLTSVSQLGEQTNVASPHKPDGETHIPIPWVNWDNMGAAGGIISSVNDLSKWMILQLQGGVSVTGDTLFQSTSQDVMWTPHNSFTVSSGARNFFPGRHFSAYGLGWSLADYQGRMLVSHGGGYDGMYSRVLLVPDEQLGIAILTNSMKGISTWLGYHILDQFFENPVRDWMAFGLSRQQDGDRRRVEEIQKLLDSRVPETSPDFAPTECVGIYRCPMYGDIRIETGEDGNLRLIFPDAPDLNAGLSHWQYNTYRIDWDQTHAWFDFGTLQFMTDHHGKVKELSFDVPNEDIFFHEIHAKRVAE